MSEFRINLESRVAALRAAPAYSNYLRVRAAIARMMDDWSRLDPDGGPSAYWQEEINGFLYLFDASPLIVEQLREQCYHITGIKSYEYRAHHTHRAHEFAEKFEALKAVDETGVWGPEPSDLGGFGFEIGGGLVNIDTLKFYEVLIGMDKAGVLRKMQQGDRKVVVEVGSGWGGFAYQFKRTCPNTTYVCVDLPPTMLFSGTYLTTLFPDAKVLFYGEEDFDKKILSLKSYDFVFLPHYYFPTWKPKRVDLAVNMVSFQEMTSKQVDGYLRRFRELGCPRVYSMNKDRSRHNDELSTVSEILGKYYRYKLIDVIDLQYTQIRAVARKKGELGVLDYRHYLAWAE